jgi:heptosyltransferase-2
MAGSQARGDSLLVRLPNYVGDAVMAWPAISRLVESGWQPTLIGRNWARDLFSASGLAVLAYPTATTQRVATLRDAARERSTRSIILLTHSFSSALEARLAGLRPTGFRKDGRGWLLAEAMGPLPPEHQVLAYWRLADRRCPAGLPEPAIRLPISDQSRSRIAMLLSAQGPHDRFVLLCPQAGGQHRGHSKDWPHFAELAAELHRAGWSTVAAPGPGEAEAFRARLPDSLLFTGLGLNEVAALAERASLTVANDCGLGHVAASAGRPVISLFGSTEPARTRPWSDRSTVLGGGGRWPTLQTTLETVLPALEPRPAVG